MAISTHTLIAQEGLPLILAGIVIVTVLNLSLGVVTAPLWLMVIALVWLYRDPLRQVPAAPLGILSPVEGIVTVAEQHPDPYLGRDAQLVRIQMSVTSVYSLRSVIEGKIMQQWLDQESEGEHDVAHAIQIQTDEKDDVVVVLRPGRFFKRLSCDANIGERIGQGHRCGIIPFGSAIDVYLPKGSRLNVKIDDHVISGETIIADLDAYHN